MKRVKKQTYTAHAILTDGTKVTIYSLYDNHDEALVACDRFTRIHSCSETWVTKN